VEEDVKGGAWLGGGEISRGVPGRPGGRKLYRGLRRKTKESTSAAVFIKDKAPTGRPEIIKS